MKKSLIMAISVISIFLISSLSVGIYFLCNHFSSNHGNSKEEISDLSGVNKKGLTNEIVKKNFGNDGIWKNKNILKCDEFLNYEYIDVDAFNDINNVIEYIELPSNLFISNSNKCDMNWTQVHEIRIKNYDKKKLFIEDNILYCRDGQNNIAYTIANRIISKNITISSYNNLPTSIHKKFYNENIFKNVTRISFSNSCLIKSIGDESFANCKILDDYIVLYSSTNYTYIGYQSFKNTNIKIFTINGNFKLNVCFSDEVF